MIGVRRLYLSEVCLDVLMHLLWQGPSVWLSGSARMATNRRRGDIWITWDGQSACEGLLGLFPNYDLSKSALLATGRWHLSQYIFALAACSRRPQTPIAPYR